MTNRHPLASAPNTAHNRRLVRAYESLVALEADFDAAMDAGDYVEARRLGHLLRRRAEHHISARVEAE